MPILNYTTSIDHEKTIGEIQKCLRMAGIEKVIIDHQNKLPVSITFAITIDGKLVGFCLPANYRGVFKAMQKSRKVPKNKLNEDQALKVSWRILKDWIEAQLAIVEAEMADLAEVFLPYVVTNDGPLYQSIKNGGGVNKFLLGDGNS